MNGGGGTDYWGVRGEHGYCDNHLWKIFINLGVMGKGLGQSLWVRVIRGLGEKGLGLIISLLSGGANMLYTKGGGGQELSIYSFVLLIYKNFDLGSGITLWVLNFF